MNGCVECMGQLTCLQVESGTTGAIAIYYLIIRVRPLNVALKNGERKVVHHLHIYIVSLSVTPTFVFATLHNFFPSTIFFKYSFYLLIS